MVVAAAGGRYADAYRAARARNPFASSCGRACDAPCQSACLRAGLDEAVQIRLLERFVCELYGPESVQPVQFSISCSDLFNIGPKPLTPPRVAVVGAGPAGLTAAHDLALLGHHCEVFERLHRPGGRLAAMPPSLLHPSVLEAEIAAILSLGIVLHLGSPVGADRWASLLNEGFDAVIVAAGSEQAIPAVRGVFAAWCPLPESAPFVYAVAGGSRAAREVHAFLTGERLEERRTSALLPERPGSRLRALSRPGAAPVPVPVAAVPRDRERARPLEVALPKGHARAAAARCVDCHRWPVVDGARCTACGVCVDICPEAALRVAPSSQVRLAGSSAPPEAPSVLVLDADRCTRCGWCSAACPEDAISMRVLECSRDIVPEGCRP